MESRSITGGGIAHLAGGRRIHHAQQEIVAYGKYETNMTNSFLPQINLTMEWTTTWVVNASSSIKSKTQINQLLKTIQEQEKMEQWEPDDTHHAHRYVLTYAIAGILICIIWKKISTARTTDNIKNKLTTLVRGEYVVT